MKLSVVIVNYNVAAFLEQSLTSAFKALKNLDGEIFVVDNNSVDNSISMVKSKFPDVILVENKENVGFAKANNQAIKMAKGEYVLLLNPDTVVEEDTFVKCVRFMDEHPQAGGLGVKMVDGNGRFLPESKRGIPYPSSAFYKLFGLSKLFPKSNKFGAYHATYIGENDTAEVEVLSGAYMMLRKSVLDKIGLLDEDYFMYGEDIDLSYRILKGGYKNYYFPETRIIHYKGESTKKGSLNYVYVFYKAMQIFAKKHFSNNNAKLFNLMINCAIWLRASLAAMKRVLGTLLLPIADFLIIFFGFFAISKYWEHAVLFHRGSAFPEYYYYIVLPCYVLIWQLSVFANGGYSKPYLRSKVNRGIVIGAVVVLLIYALLPETMRFSRAVVVMGAMWTLVAANFLRHICEKLNVKGFNKQYSSQRIAIVGAPDEMQRVLQIVQTMNVKRDFIGLITIDESQFQHPFYIGDVKNLHELLRIYKIGEVVFCGRDISSEKIIDLMNLLKDLQVEYKIAPEDSALLIGSTSIFTTESLYAVPINPIYSKQNQRKKRLFDIVFSCFLLLFLLIDVWFVDNKSGFIRNIFNVLLGKHTWVGVKNEKFLSNNKLKSGILFPNDIYQNTELNSELYERVEELYVKDYSIGYDFSIIIKAFRQLGR